MGMLDDIASDLGSWKVRSRGETYGFGGGSRGSGSGGGGSGGNGGGCGCVIMLIIAYVLYKAFIAEDTSKPENAGNTDGQTAPTEQRAE